VRSWIDVQIVAFPQEGILSHPKGAELMEEALKLGADAVGVYRTSSTPARWARRR
jgi:cytosine deaminase